MYSCPPRTDPGLDLHHLASLRTPPRPLRTLTHQIAAHLEEHDGYLAFSGGKDSLVALHLARRVEPNIPVCFFDSGFEFPETYTYIADLAEQWQLNLDVIPTTHSTLELLIQSGTWDHHSPVSDTTPNGFRNNILEPSQTAHQRYGPGRIWGLRAQESRGRKQTFIQTISAGHPGHQQLLDGTATYSPAWDWTTNDIWGYIHRHQIPTNPVYAKLAHLGAPDHAIRVSHLLDATQLELGRLVWLKRGWPSLFERIVDHLPRAAEAT